MVSELGECIPCFPDNHGRFGVTGSDLGNGMRKLIFGFNGVKHMVKDHSDIERKPGASI